jgi:Cu/Zn superoxide dismutase
MRCSSPFLPRISLALIPLALAACSEAESRDAGDMVDSAEAAVGRAIDDVADAADRDEDFDVLFTSDFRAPENVEAPEVEGTVKVLVAEADMQGTATPRLRVELRGLTPGEHAWHVHSGPCGTPAPIEIALTATADTDGLVSPLVADAAGEAEAEVPVPALADLMLGEGHYSLHVHEFGGIDHGAAVACADL